MMPPSIASPRPGRIRNSPDLRGRVHDHVEDHVDDHVEDHVEDLVEDLCRGEHRRYRTGLDLIPFHYLLSCL